MKTIAIYPGTFDPITNGHTDLIRRSASIFPKVIVLVASDTKKECLFKLDERVEMVSQAVESCCEAVEVVPFHGLLVDAVKKHSAKIIIRGLRAVSDFEYESQMALMNRRLEKSIESFFMISSEEYAYLSSSFVKEIAGLGGDVSSMVPPGVVERLRQHFSKIR
jgi:pantetheine-phosphate adenylyltransferase